MTSRHTTPESVFAPVIGQMAWQVHADEHGCVMMEFGAPHLDIREPRPAPDISTKNLQRLLSRRVVRVVGDWHVWIESCDWTLKTKNGATSSRADSGEFWRDWMDDVAGQRLISVAGQHPGSLRLGFDMGAVFEVRPDKGGELDSWSLHVWRGEVTSCSAAGRLTVERPATT